MPRLPTTTLSHLTRPPTLSRTAAIAQRHLQTQQQPGAETVEGASGKDENKAQPKILSQSPPKDEDASEETKNHNKDFNKRAERAAEKVEDGELKNDKVGKGFWSGGDKVGATKDGGHE